MGAFITDCQINLLGFETHTNGRSVQGQTIKYSKGFDCLRVNTRDETVQNRKWLTWMKNSSSTRTFVGNGAQLSSAYGREKNLASTHINHRLEKIN